MKINFLLGRVVINTVSQVAARVITVLLSLFTVGILTRYLGLEGYGYYTLVFAYLSFFGVIADFGLHLNLVKDLSQRKNHPKSFRSTYFSLKLFLILLSSVVAIGALRLFPYSQFVKYAISMGSIAVAVGYLHAYAISILQSQIRLDLAAIFEVINRIVTVVMLVVFVSMQLNLYYLVAATLVGNLVSVLLDIYFLGDYYKISSFFDSSLLKGILKNSIPIGFTSLFALLYFKVDTLMLSVMRPVAEVGLYSLSYKIFENILIIWVFYMASIYPLIYHPINGIYRN